LAKQHRRLARERERLHRIAAQVAAQRTGVHRAE
jgi:hypothetical protein